MKNVYIVGALQTEATTVSALVSGIMSAPAKVNLTGMVPGSIGVAAVFSSKRAAQKFAGKKYEILCAKVGRREDSP